MTYDTTDKLTLGCMQYEQLEHKWTLSELTNGSMQHYYSHRTQTISMSTL